MKTREDLEQNSKALQPSQAEKPGEKTEREQLREEKKLKRAVAGQPRALEDNRINTREAKAMRSEVLRLAASGLLDCLTAVCGEGELWEPRREGASRESGQDKVTFKLGFER